jgi:uncharacterized repeat protein (TIGR01451 family)
MTSNANGDGSGTLTVGDILTFTISVTNSGSTTLTNVEVSNKIISPGSNYCDTLAPGESCVLVGTYTVIQTDEDAGVIRFTTSGDSNETGPVIFTEFI